jgi:tetratricopeptide (TPR) repeat protein
MHLSAEAPAEEVAKVLSNRSAAFAGLSELDEIPSWTDDETIAAADAALSKAERQQEALERALEDAQACIEICPVWAKGYFRKGCVLMQLQQWEEARDVLKQGLQHAPEGGAGDILKSLKEINEQVVKLEIDRDSRQRYVRMKNRAACATYGA